MDLLELSYLDAPFASENPDVTVIRKMSPKTPEDIKDVMQMEKSALERQLEEVQAVNESLALSLKEKEEKISEVQKQTESMCKKYLYEIDELQRKMDTIREVDALQMQIITLENNVKQLHRISKCFNNSSRFSKKLEKYDNIVSHQTHGLHAIIAEIKTVRDHISNIELAYSDVSRKYEGNKSTLFENKAKQEQLEAELNSLNDSQRTVVEIFAQTKCTTELELKGLLEEKMKLEENYTKTVKNMNAQVKRLVIKVASLEKELSQKESECSELSKLYDDLSFKKEKL